MADEIAKKPWYEILAALTPLILSICVTGVGALFTHVCFSTVEPVFGNLRHNKRLDRFTLRGRMRVDGQWKLYCLTHNIEKLATHGA